MNYRELTDIEKKYLAEGGRVFLVGERNEVFILRDAESTRIRIISDNDEKPIQYETKKMALETAQMIASLSEDTPMVEGEIID